jgi:hypothetical protein
MTNGPPVHVVAGILAVLAGGLLLRFHEQIGRLDEERLRASGYPLSFVRFVEGLARNVAVAFGILAPAVGVLTLSGGRGGTTACAGVLLMVAGLLLLRYGGNFARFEARLSQETNAPTWFWKPLQIGRTVVNVVVGLLTFSLGLLLLLLGVSRVSLLGPP